MESNQTREIVEALLFSCDSPVRVRTLTEVIGDGVSNADIRAAIKELNLLYETNGSSFEIVEIAGGMQLLTRPAFDVWVRRLQKTRQRARLSRAALEALAIIAYRQPVTRPEIEAIRGVDCGGVMTTLQERGLIKISGRSEGVGRPLLYATTPAFLEHFGLRSLSQMPRIEEITASLDRRSLADTLAQELGGEPEEFSETIETRLAGGNGNGNGNGSGNGNGEGTAAPVDEAIAATDVAALEDVEIGVDGVEDPAADPAVDEGLDVEVGTGVGADPDADAELDADARTDADAEMEADPAAGLETDTDADLDADVDADLERELAADLDADAADSSGLPAGERSARPEPVVLEQDR